MEHHFHREIKTQIAEHYKKLTPIVYTELKLPNNCIADVFAITSTYEVHIIEVKTEYKYSMIGAAVSKYHQYCDRLYVAFPEQVIPASTDQTEPLNWQNTQENAGIIAVNNGQVMIRRAAAYRKMDSVKRQYIDWMTSKERAETQNKLGIR